MKYIENIIPIYDKHANKIVKKESEIQKGVNDLLDEILIKHDRGFYYHPSEDKFTKNKGLPDIMAFYSFKEKIINFAIELKKINFHPTDYQINMLKKLKEKARFEVSVCYSVSDVLDFLTDIGIETNMLF